MEKRVPWIDEDPKTETLISFHKKEDFYLIKPNYHLANVETSLVTYAARCPSLSHCPGVLRVPPPTRWKVGEVGDVPMDTCLP